VLIESEQALDLQRSIKSRPAKENGTSREQSRLPAKVTLLFGDTESDDVGNDWDSPHDLLYAVHAHLSRPWSKDLAWLLNRHD
jgi:hypothetical protein